MGCFLLIAGMVFAQVPKPDGGAVARGKYIVENVAICRQCHTPMNSKGERDAGQALMGGPLQLEPTYRSPAWAIRAPRIAGGPPGTDQDFIRLMTTGISRRSASRIFVVVWMPFIPFGRLKSARSRSG